MPVSAEKRFRPRIAVALEYADQPVVGHILCRIECRLYLSGMMGIVVINPYVVPFAHELKPSLCKLVFPKGALNGFKRRIERECHDCRRKRIEHIVVAYHRQLYSAERFAFVHNVKRGIAKLIACHVTRSIVSVAYSVRHGLYGRLRHKFFNPLVVATAYKQSVLGQKIYILSKRIDDVVYIPIIVEMVVIYVIYERYRRS